MSNRTCRCPRPRARPGARLRLNGKPVSGPLTDAGLRLAGDESLVVEVAAPARNGAADERAAYAVHCVPHDFPDVEVVRKEPGRAPGLLLVTPYYSVAGADEPRSYLAILDDNGVPRFIRRSSPPAHNFRWHEGAGVYSYNEAQPNAAGDVVLLDERLEEVGRVNTVGGLAPAMMHEFLITGEGNYLFIANTPAVRDLSRYPAPDGKPAPTDAQATHDSVIQEVAPDGREVFRWNAWDHLKLSDCAGWQFFPDKYAHLNSLDLDEAGNVLAGFRGCSQALKIKRPSGRVLWQLGGSDPAAPDAYDERRPGVRPALVPAHGRPARRLLHPAFGTGNRAGPHPHVRQRPVRRRRRPGQPGGGIPPGPRRRGRIRAPLRARLAHVLRAAR